MKVFYACLLMLLSVGALAQPFTNMPNGNGSSTLTSCNRQIRDHNGNGWYSNNQNSTLTICSGSAAQHVSLNFTQFNLEVNDDFLTIYLGPTATGTPYLSLTGNGLAVTNYNFPSDCITLVFTSDGNVTRPGFRATLSCYTAATCTDGIMNGTETGVDCGGCDGCPPCAINSTPATVTATASTTTLPCGGGPVDLLAIGVSTTPVLTSNFDAGNPGPGWSFTGSGMFTNPCGPSPSGTTHLWFGNASPHPRLLTSNGLDLSCGGTICFDFKTAIQGQAGSCEGPDLPNEGMTLSFSTDCGLTFQNIAYFHPNGTIIGANPGTNNPQTNGTTNFTTWGNYCFPIPAAAQTANTIIRWSQLATSGAPFDHWGLDEVVITANNCNPYYYDWAHVAGTPNPAGNTVNVSQTTTYDVIYTNGIDDTASASVTVVVAGPATTSISTTPVDYCVGTNSGSATFTGTGTTSPPYSFAVVGPAGFTTTLSGNPTATLNNLPVGNYTVTTSDGTGCSAVDTFSIVGGPFCCDVVITPTNLLCNSNDAPCNGTTQAVTSNGLSPYTYQWYTGTSSSTPIVGQTNQTMGSLCAGTYTVLIADQSGCIDSATVTLTQPTGLTITGSHTDVSCFAGADGTISVTAGGGSATYTYSLGTTSNTTGNFSNLSQGNYTVSATDINGCTIDTLITIVEPTLLNFNVLNVNDAFCGLNNGLINISASGGVGPYTYDIGGGVTNSNGTFSNLAPGNYAVIITDANSCTITTFQIIVNGQPSPTLSVDSIAHETCFGSNSGYISVSGTGNFPLQAMTYSINGVAQTPGNNNVFSNLSAGTYNIVISDPNGCADSTLVTITSPPLLTASLVVSDVSCNGSCDGTITPTIVGGTAPYTYSLNGGVIFNNPPLTGLCAGTYNYVVQDANGCLANQTVNITQPNPINFTGVETTATCGFANGIFTISTVTGGSGAGYTFSFDGSPFTPSLAYTGLGAGFYWLVIQDGAGCLDSNVVLIQNIDAPLLVNTIVVPNLCFGQTLGEIIATATDTTALNINPGPYNFSINGGPFAIGNALGGDGNDYTGLANGIYITQVQDQNGCIRLDTLTITSPSELFLFETHGDLNCTNDGTGFINLIASGGVGPYTYDVGNGQPSNGFGFFGSLPAGTYSPQVTDDNGCITTLPNIIITEPTPLVVSAPFTNPLCATTCDGTVSFTASGSTPGYTYSLNNGTTVFSNPNFTSVCAGTYTYLVEDVNGCTESGTITLIDPPALMLSAVNTSATCNNPNGTITATGSGGTGAYSYSLNNGATQPAQLFAGLNAGSFLVDVFDGNGCNAEITQTVGQAGGPSISSITVTNVICNGANDGTATINASGGTIAYSYSLNGAPGQASPTFTGLANGAYTVAVTDANGCVANSTFNITQPTALAINAPVVVNIACNGLSTGSITINPTGGVAPYQYSFDGGVTFSSANNITSVPAGTYNIQVMDASNCVETINVSIAEPGPMSINPNTNDASCFGVCDGSIDLQAIGGTAPLSFNWTFNVAPNTSDIATNLCAGTYSAIITDFNGCTLNSGDFIINEPAQVQILSVIADSTSCFGINDGVITINSLNTTTYQISGPIGFQSNATGVFTGLPTGYYDITVADANGCQATSSTFIYEPADIVVTTSGNVIACPNDPVTHSAYVSGGTIPYSYTWSNADVTSATTVVAAGPLTLFIDVVDANGCPAAQETLTHSVTPPLQIDPIADIFLCDGDSSLVTATAQDGQPDPLTGYVFTWNHLDPGLDTNQAWAVANGNPAVYTVLVKDMCDDFDSTTVQVFAYQPVDVTLTGPANACAPELESFTITSPALLSNCTWDFGDGTTGTGCGTVTHNYTVPGTYTVQFSYDAYGACPFDTTFTDVLEIFENPVFTSIALVDPLCNGSADGTITLNGNLGLLPYDYQLNGGVIQTTNLFNGQTSGTYTATIIDQNGCSVDSLVTLTDPPALAITDVSITNILCFGDSTGSISMTVTGGTPAIQYSFDGGVTYSSASTIGSLGAGVYHIFARDMNLCTVDSMNVTVTQPNELVIDLVSVTNASCYDECDGSIFVGYIGGTAPITYTWSPNASTANVATASNLCDGSYDIILTDNNNCSVDSLSISISEPPQIVVTSLTIDSVSCFAAADGEITATATNGDTYELTGPMPTVNNTTGIFTGLIPGAYTLTIFDVNLCSIDTLVNIFEPTVLAMTNSGDTTVCYAVPVTHTATVTGGTTPYSITWDTGATGPNLTYTALQDTNIAVTVVDANGCTVGPQSIAITVIPLLAINPLVDQTLCIGDSILVNASAVNGSAPYTFHWNNLPIGNNTNPQYLQGTNNPTVYWVSVTDQCNDIDSAQINVFNYTAPTFNLTGPVDGCNPQNETFTIVGASSPMSNCTWDFGNGITAVGCGTQNVLYDSAAVYSVTLTYEAFAGCSFDTTFADVLEIFDNPIVDSIDIQNPSCNGDADGQLTVYASGGTVPYSYQLGAGALQLTNTFTGMTSGLYSYTVSDINNCVASDFVVLIDPPVLTIDNIAITDALCNGDSTGTITLTGLGGTTPYQYSFDGGLTYSASNDTIGVPAGTYHVIIKDSNDCEVENLNVVVGAPASVLFDFVTVTDASCFGVCDGTISVGGIGGTAPYTFSWSANAATGNNAIANALCADTFIATITDANGCSVDSSGIIVGQPPLIVITSLVTDSVNCFGGSDGSATITAPLATNFEITGPVNVSQASNIFTGLPIGIYTLQLTDVNGCTIDSSFQIFEPTVITYTNIAIQANLCNGDNTGGITITAAGGTAPYTYSFDGGAYGTADSNMTLLAGSHDLSIQDANGCIVDSLGVIITEPTPMTIDVVAVVDAQCNGDSTGSITLTASGGTATYTYSFDGGVTFGASNASGPLPAGTYNVAVQDMNGCITDSLGVIIGEPTPVTFDLVTITDASCFGVCDGTIAITAIGGTPGYTYSWSANAATGNNATATALCADTFIATITDINGCTVDSAGIIVGQPDEIEITALVTDSVSCFGGTDGSVTITALNAVNYEITGPVNVSQASNIFLGLPMGAYTLQLTDVNGCTLDSSFSIFEPTEITFDNIAIQMNDCNGDNTGGITITAGGGTGPYTYSFNGNAGPFTMVDSSMTLTAGSYDVSIQDANGCIADSIGVIVTEPTPINVDAMVINDASCFSVCDGDITATVSGGTPGYTYTWSANAATGNVNAATNLCAGSYDLQITDINGCILDTNANLVGEPAQVIFVSVTTDSVNCFGAADGVINVTATNAVSYSINAGPTQPTGNFPGLTAGFYTITITGVNGCIATADTTIFEPTPLVISTGNDTTVCANSNANLFGFASGGIAPYTFQWTGLPAGANQTVNPATTTMYTLNVTDANGCPAGPENTTVTVFDALTADPLVGATVCPSGSSIVTANVLTGVPVYTYAWSPAPISGQGTPSADLSVGTYNLLITDNCGATVNQPVTISPFDEPVFAFSGLDDGCAPHTVNIDPNNGTVSNCSWILGDGSTATGCGPITHTYTTPGTYDVTFSYTSANNCVFDTTVINAVTVSPTPIASFTFNPTDPSLTNNTVNFANTSIGGSTYAWTFGSDGVSSAENPIYTFPASNPADYNICLTVTDVYPGYVCESTYCEIIPLNEEFSIYVPNAFTPDNNEHNNEFRAIILGERTESFEMQIFNRWGEVIYESRDHLIGWDGTYGGKVCQDGTYIWKIRLKDKNVDDVKTFTGHVVLLR